jgi:hypothetical protein
MNADQNAKQICSENSQGSAFAFITIQSGVVWGCRLYIRKLDTFRLDTQKENRNYVQGMSLFACIKIMLLYWVTEIAWGCSSCTASSSGSDSQSSSSRFLFFILVFSLMSWLMKSHMVRAEQILSYK